MRDVAGGGEQRIRADYLIAADGNRAGIRNDLGAGADGPGVLIDVANFIFEADLSAASGQRRFLLAYLGQPRPGATLRPLNELGRWALAIPCQPGQGETLEDFTEERCAGYARAAVGVPDLELRLVPPVPEWHQKVTSTRIGAWVAQRYRSGRVFFAGDAAHVVPPSGSYGANTGIADAPGVELAAVVRGQAGAGLLDTYETERRPVAQVTLETAKQLPQDRREGAGAEITRVDDTAMIFGYRCDSDAVLSDAPAPGARVENPRGAEGRPGLRAPHVWLTRTGQRGSPSTCSPVDSPC